MRANRSIRIKNKKIKIIALEDFQKISNNYANLIINAIVSGNKSKFYKIKNGEKFLFVNIKFSNIENYKKKLSKKKEMVTISLGGGEVYDGEILKVIKSLYPIFIILNLITLHLAMIQKELYYPNYL